MPDNASLKLSSLRTRLSPDKHRLSNRPDTDRNNLFESSRAAAARPLDGLHDRQRLPEQNFRPDHRFDSLRKQRHPLAVEHHRADDDPTNDHAHCSSKTTLHRKYRHKNDDGYA